MNGHFLNDLLATLGQRYAARGRGRSGGKRPTARAVLDQCDAVLASDGEASTLAQARAVLDHYEALADDDKQGFFEGLARRYAPDPEQVASAYERYRLEPDSVNAQALSRAARSARQELLRRLNTPPGQTFALVRMRADLQRFLRDAPELASVDADFMDLFRSWFNRGFLVLRRIDWHTPASVLDKIIAYEAVHAIDSWDDLRRRLDPADRRCFAFFHPATGDEPLVFVQVALTRDIPGQVQAILNAEHGSAQADTATFFSISNCQAGLRGISFGNFLIKQVVQELRGELPELRQFVTLSPIPGFTQWVNETRRDHPERLDEEALTAIDTLAAEGAGEALRADAPELRKPLMQLAARYLYLEKDPAGQPRDAVSRFHLGNGASIHRINWLGDRSDKGIRQSYGVMVNYLYRLGDIERNHEAFVAQGRIRATREIQRLARRAEAARSPVGAPGH